MKLKDTVFRLMESAGPTLARFRVPVAFSVAATLVFMICIGKTGNMDPYIETGIALGVGFLASLLGVTFAERRSLPGSDVWGLLGAPIAAIAYFAGRGLAPSAIARVFAMSLFLFLGFLVVPNLGRKERFSPYVSRLFAHAVVSALFSAVIYIGLTLIAFTLDSLFSLHMDYRVYLRLWLSMAGIVLPFLVMTGIPKDQDDVESEPYPKVLANLLLYVVTPLIAVYSAILYAYFGKVILTGEWPVGLVSHLVLWYSSLSVAVLCFQEPLERESAWAKTFGRIFPRAVIPLLAMMFFGMGVRVKHYGITPNRYYVLVAGAWVLGSVLYLAFSPKKRRWVPPAALAIVAILAVVGPWSAYPVSIASQNQRLEGILERNGMLEGGTVTRARGSVSSEDRDEISSIVAYFGRTHDLGDIRALPQGFQMDDFEAHFGFANYIFPLDIARKYLRADSGHKSYSVKGYDSSFTLSAPSGEDVVSQGPVSVGYDQSSAQIWVSVGQDRVWTFDLLTHFHDILTDPSIDDRELIPAELTVVTAELPGFRAKLLIHEIWLVTGAGAQGSGVVSVQFTLLTAID